MTWRWGGDSQTDGHGAAHICTTATACGGVLTRGVLLTRYLVTHQWAEGRDPCESGPSKLTSTSPWASYHADSQNSVETRQTAVCTLTVTASSPHWLLRVPWMPGPDSESTMTSATRIGDFGDGIRWSEKDSDGSAGPGTPPQDLCLRCGKVRHASG